jgi:PKD repeat protein
MTALPLAGIAPLTVTFTSVCPTCVVYVWDFGDGASIGGGTTQTHIYKANGSYNALLAAADKAGQQLSAQAIITVGNVVANCPLRCVLGAPLSNPQSCDNHIGTPPTSPDGSRHYAYADQSTVAKPCAWTYPPLAARDKKLP